MIHYLSTYDGFQHMRCILTNADDIWSELNSGIHTFQWLSEFSNDKKPDSWFNFHLNYIDSLCFIISAMNILKFSDTNCWAPTHFAGSSVKYAESSCHTKFADVLYGRSTAEEARIWPPYWDHIPCATNDTNCTVPNSFATAMEIVQSQGSDLPQFSGEDLRNGMLYTTRMLNMLCVYAGLVILGFVIAVCFSRVAHANTCFLEAAWQSAAGGSSSDSYGAEGGDKGGLLNNTSSVVTRRLAMLANSRGLAISYFAFLVVMLFVFIILGGMTAHETNLALKETNKEIDMEIAVYKKYKEIRKTKTLEETGAEQDDVAGGKAQPEQGSTGDAPLSEIDKLVQKLFQPHPTHDSGSFLCDFEVRRLGNIQRYTVQCNYKVSRTPDKGHYYYMDMILEVKQAVDAGCWLAFLMVILLAIHILNVFLLSPMSNQNSLILVMKEIGMDAPTRGLGFGFTDLAFVASFIPMGSRTRYSMNGRVWKAKQQGAVSIRKTVLPGMAIPMLKIRRPNGRLIFNMEITIRR